MKELLIAVGVWLVVSAAITIPMVVVEVWRSCGRYRACLTDLYESVWDADETVPQVRKKSLRQIQEKIEKALR